MAEDRRDEDRLPSDGMGCRLNGSENLRPALGIEFVPIEAEEEAFADGFRGGLWVLLQDRRFNERARRLAHRATHREPFFSGPLHKHGPVADIHLRRGILH